MRELKIPGLPSTLIPFLILVNALIIFAAPSVNAVQTCSPTGGHSGTYLAKVTDPYDQNGGYTNHMYGVGSNIVPESWKFYPQASPNNGRIMWWTGLWDPSSTPQYWAQSGYLNGTESSQTTSSKRLIFFEQGLGGTINSVILITGYPIPNYDSGYVEVWDSGSDPFGHPYWTAKAYSSTYNTWWSTTYTMGTNEYYGQPQVSAEAGYLVSQYCNVFYQYTYSNGAAYTTSTGSEPYSAGTHWASCNQVAPDSPYNYQLLNTCHDVIDFWGGS